MTRCFKLYTIYCAVVKKFELCGSLFRDFTNICVKIICEMLSETAPGYSTLLYSSLFCDRIQFIKLRESSECSLEQNPFMNRSVQIPSFFSSVFSHIRTEYRRIRIRKTSVFGHFSHSGCAPITPYCYFYMLLLFL